MKILKRILILVAVIFAAIFVLALFLPSRYHVERSIVINAPVDSVFQNLNNLKKWQDWIPNNRDNDSTFVMHYSGPSEGVGAMQDWEARKLGKGAIKITKSEFGKLVEFEESLGESNYKANGAFLLTSSGNEVRVTWQDEGSLGYNPISRIMGRYYDRIIGGDYEKGLHNLKNICEKQPVN